MDALCTENKRDVDLIREVLLTLVPIRFELWNLGKRNLSWITLLQRELIPNGPRFIYVLNSIFRTT